MTAGLGALRARHPDASWIPQASLHLTLVFLGWLPNERVPAIGAVARSVAQRHEPIDVGIGPAGGNARASSPGVAWLQLARGGHHVVALASALAAALAEIGLTDRDDRPVAGSRPHLTIARRASVALVRDAQAVVAAGLAVTWRADEMTLFRSHLGQHGSRYQPLARFPLLGAPQAEE